MKHLVGRKQEVAELGKLRVVVEGVPILLVWVDHQVFAIGDKCPHLGTSLEKGTIEDGVVTCKSHKAKIDVRTGDILEKAQILFVKMPTKKAMIYGIEEKDGDLYINL